MDDLDKLEPRAKDLYNRAGRPEASVAVALNSIAMSLKRIADVMQMQHANKLLDDLANMDTTPRS